MPELPEVETIRRQLEPEITGRRIVAAEVFDERWTRPTPPRDVERALTGRTIESVERRGKYLLLRLEGDRTLAMHLRMTGNLLLEDGAPDPPYLRAQLRLDDGRRLLFTDTRRFGQAIVLRDEELDEYFAARLGIEPLSDSLTAEEVCRRAAGRRAPLKSFLLNQLGVAGIGNI
jgi:formamidopyrimidine-DNA glycosylase